MRNFRTLTAVAHAFLRSNLLDWFEGPSDGLDLAGQEILSDSVLIKLAASNIVEIDDGHRDVIPSKQLTGLVAPLARNQQAVPPHYNGVEEANCSDAVGKAVDIAQVVAMALSHLDVGYAKTDAH